jgi:pimeloyl-ACP methyl ester carboxylesterase
LVRHFASAEHPAKDALGFQRTHVVADAGHSVQGDQPASLVAILRDLAGA